MRTALAALAAAALLAGVAAAGEQHPVRSSKCYGAASRDPRRPCHDPALRHVVVPSPEQALLVPYATCEPLKRSGLLAPCRFGSEEQYARSAIALIGDSHAGHWRAAIRKVAQFRRWRATSLTRTACPFTRARLALPPGRGRACAAWNRQVTRWLRHHPEVHTIFVSALAGIPVRVAPGRSQLQARVRGVLAAWRRLPKTVEHVLVLRDVPVRPLRTVDCVEHAVAHRGDPGTDCAAPRRNVLHPDAQAIAARRLGAAHGVHLLDMTSYMCGRRRCLPVVGGALVDKDTGHMTTAFAASLGRYVLKRVNKLYPPKPGFRPRPITDSRRRAAAAR